MKSINDIYQQYIEGKYTFYPAIIPPKLKDGYIFDENKTVKENREMLEDYNNKRQIIVNNNVQGHTKMNQKLREDVIATLMDDYGISRAKAVFVENICYEKYHSSFSDYFCYIEDMTSDFIKFSKLD